MTGIKPSSHGIVVDHRESGTRFAISDKNYDEKLHHKVRDLRPGETVWGFQPKRRLEVPEGADVPLDGPNTPEPGARSALDASEALADGSAATRKANKTEGAAPAASQEKEGK